MKILENLDKYVDGSSYEKQGDAKSHARREKRRLRFLKKMGERIKNIRESKGFSQEVLCLKIKMKQSCLADIENGIPQDQVHTMLKKIAEGLDIAHYMDLIPDD